MEFVQQQLCQRCGVLEKSEIWIEPGHLVQNQLPYFNKRVWTRLLLDNLHDDSSSTEHLIVIDRSLIIPLNQDWYFRFPSPQILGGFNAWCKSLNLGKKLDLEQPLQLPGLRGQIEGAVSQQHGNDYSDGKTAEDLLCP